LLLKLTPRVALHQSKTVAPNTLLKGDSAGGFASVEDGAPNTFLKGDSAGGFASVEDGAPNTFLKGDSAGGFSLSEEAFFGFTVLLNVMLVSCFFVDAALR
ncbi:hypothetical protein TcG_09511, partial [Trypanosoma cruzi]